MTINILGTSFGWWPDEAFALYLIVDAILVMLYSEFVSWATLWVVKIKQIIHNIQQHLKS